ncbi:MAG: 2Fe-2S iron-sulfur cluster-binding protein [Cyclobacteriaceae bacterium]
MEPIELVVKEVIKETKDAVSVHFEQPSTKMDYEPGQFLTLIFDIKGKEERRAYSLCSSPLVDEFPAVAVKRVNKGLVSNHVNDHVKAGDKVRILEPMGTFTLESNKADHIVLLGGGSGITPLLSILKTTLKDSSSSKVSLIYVNKDKESIIFADRIKELEATYRERLNVVHHLDSDNVKKRKLGIGKKTVLLSEDKLNELITGLNIDKSGSTSFFICGPTGMMDVAEKTLINMSFPKETIKKESFVAAASTELKGLPAEAKKVKVKYQGQNYDFNVKPGTTVLQAALDEGVELPFSCQGGLCTACMGKLIQGKLEMRDNMALTDQEVDNGFVLTCVGHPTTDDVEIEIE